MIQSITDNITGFLEILTGKRSAREYDAAVKRENDIKIFINLSKNIRVLDLANGWLRPQYSIFQKQGYHVVGIDLVNLRQSTLLNIAHMIARWLYRRWIPRSEIVQPNATRLICGDVSNLPFADNSFDLICSIAAFEHFLDVPTVISEIHRITRPGGIVHARIHLFTCPSGGHNVKLMEIPLRRLPKGVEPWDHLRKRQLPINVPLNEWRIQQYLDAFAQHFEIVKNYCALREGEGLLSPQIESELRAYSREELSCGSYVIVAKKS